MSSDANHLRSYLNNVNVCKIPLTCALCPDFRGVARDLRTHLHSDHAVGSETRCCAWCLGRYSWPNRQKTLHWKHLKECFESYKDLYGSRKRAGRKRRQPQPAKKAKIADSKKVRSDFSAACVERGLYGREKLSGLDERAYEHLFLPDLEGIECRPEFRDNVRLAHQCVSMYQKKTYFWYHLMVRAAAFDLFCKVMENNCEKNSYFLLPFWCWCDGGSETNLYLRHHRHMILATTIPKFSTTIWQKIKMKKGTPNCKLAKPLQSVWHLVNTINYVSNLRSRCNFSFQKDGREETMEVVREKNHFYIGTSLPKKFKLYIAGVMEKGFLNLLNELFGNLSVASFMEHAVREKNKQWRVQVKHLLQIKEIHEILPLTNVWKMTDKTSGEGFLHTLNNHKIFFDRDEDLNNVHFRQWVSMQIDCGNVFLDAIQEEFWTPTLSQQKVLNVVMPVFESNKKLHLKIEEKDSNLDKKDEEMRMLLSKFEEMAEEMKKLYSLLNQRDEEIRNLHSKLNQKEEENILLRSQLENLQNAEIERLKEENKYLREENKNSREELKKAYEEIKNLNTKVIAKLEDENKRILQILGEKSEEIKQLREENKRLKEELNYFRNREKINLVD